jgi:sugar lactone lactonase YvrE
MSLIKPQKTYLNLPRRPAFLTRASLVLARGTLGLAVLAGGIVWLGSSRASATILYATSIAGQNISQVDTVANTVSTYFNTSSGADSIMFDPSQRLIYTLHYTGEVRRYDPMTLTDTGIASGLYFPADIALEPGGNSMLVSEIWGGNIKRINLTTFGVTTLLTGGGNPEGLAYVGTRLFANLGYRNTPSAKYVAELNPITGSILAQSPYLDSLDGLTYDSYSGLLYASSLNGNRVYSIDPNNLNTVNDVSSKLGNIPGPDGITSDGIGNIFIAAGGNEYVYQLDLVNNTLTQKNYVYGLDDLAPASGLGSPMPEPSAATLAGLGLAGLLMSRGRAKK